ncbi:MAG: imidazole glycerol phosphate synthase subunit HisH [Promethearchaeota archaeon]|jgi:glutamine amidotransferase
MPFTIAIIDYEMGNLKSIYKLLQHLNIESIITSDHKRIRDVDGVILPGVGAFGDAMRHLHEKKLTDLIVDLVEEGKPLLGICLGQHLLFSHSSEMGTHNGLDIIKGSVISFDKIKVKKVPQIGWNSVSFLKKDHFIVQGIPNNSYFYFVHSFYAIPNDSSRVLGNTMYGNTEFCSMVCKENVVAVQFHPEKSSKNGIKMYENFIQYCRK